jgi:hypothetical protein
MTESTSDHKNIAHNDMQMHISHWKLGLPYVKKSKYLSRDLC